MKKVAVVALILLLVISLGTSVFLLLGQKKANSKADGLEKSAKLNSDTLKDLKDKFNTQKKAAEKAEKAKTRAEASVKTYKKLADNADKRAKGFEDQLAENLAKPPPADNNETAELKAKLDKAMEDAGVAEKKISSLEEQMKNAEKTAAELEAAQAELANINELKKKIADLEEKRPVKFSSPALPVAKPRKPGKLKPESNPREPKPDITKPKPDSPNPAPQPKK